MDLMHLPTGNAIYVVGRMHFQSLQGKGGAFEEEKGVIIGEREGENWNGSK